MKRILVLTILLGLAVFGLIACQHEDSDTSVGVVTSEAVVEDTQESDAAANTETTDSQSADEIEDPSVPSDAALSDTVAADPESGSVRGPISILGNADFTVENGVLGGTGTTDDPYMIAGWEIVVPASEYYGVRIENVTAQFVLRGLVIQNATNFEGAGIRVGFASGGAIEGCSVTNSMHGVTIVSSTDISMENCLLYVSGNGLRVIGETEDQYRHEIADTNLYNDKPIYYFYGLDGETISGLTGGHLTVAGSRNVTIRNNEVTSGDGMVLAFVEDSTITLNLVHRLANVITDHGIHLYESHNNSVVENWVKNNRLAGIQLTLANGNEIARNVAQANDKGIRVLASDGNRILDNSIYANVSGIILFGASTDNLLAGNEIWDDSEHMAEGIVLEAAFSNTVERNLIFGSEIGIALDPQASGNTVSDNTAVSGGYGLSVEGSNNRIERNLLAQYSRAVLFPETFQRSITQGNTFVGNVFADNNNHIYTNLDSSGNQFSENVFLNEGRDMVNDQGTGNVWMMNGLGNFWGFGSVTDSDGDGIGDRPVTVYPSDIDDTAPLAVVDARQLGLGIVGTLELGVTTIETRTGDTIEVPAYVASKPYERATGFRGFPSELIAGFPGILFVFEDEKDPTTSGFTMVTVPFDLDIAFFNADGEWAGGTTMTAQATELYKAGAPYQYALELPSGTMEELGIGSGSTLVLP